ncbi:MAG: hypothetical protein KF856_02360 [Cyclobacteriaceae bacterium]|nr:hypothetical protein [Cyclobacteriaceae bacterium]
MTLEEKRKTFLGLNVDRNSTPLIVFGVVIGFWALSWFLVVWLIKPDENQVWAVRGQFGDMFGAINALFSGLAFAGVILTILLQREELRAQKEELRLNTEALNAQKNEMNAQWKELEKQNSNLKRQRFETTFFNMWNIHFNNRDLITVNNHTGILAFAYFIKSTVGFATKQSEVPGEMKFSVLNKAAVLSSSTNGFFPMAETYVNSLKLIHSYVIDAGLKPKAKKRYLNFMRSYLSVSEVEFLIYYTNYLKNNKQENSILPLYNDLQISENFVSSFEQRWRLKLVFDGGIL